MGWNCTSPGRERRREDARARGRRTHGERHEVAARWNAARGGDERAGVDAETGPGLQGVAGARVAAGIEEAGRTHVDGAAREIGGGGAGRRGAPGMGLAAQGGVAREAEPASKKIAPPLPPPCPPSASSVAAAPIERSRHASTSIMPPAFGPLADTFTGPFAVMFLPLATQSDPPSSPERIDVAAALTSGLPSTTSRPAQSAMAPSGPSARSALAGASSVMSESAIMHRMPHPTAALASMLPRRIARPSALMSI